MARALHIGPDRLPSMDEQSKLSAKIDADIQRFLKTGGKIEVLPPPQRFAPTEMHVTDHLKRRALTPQEQLVEIVL